MRIHVIQELTRDPAAAGGWASVRVAAPIGRESEPFAWIVETNPLDPPGGGKRWAIPLDDVRCPDRLIAWSGTLAPGLFDRDARSWMPAARAAFEAACDGLKPRLELVRRRLLFRGCSRHVLADPQSCRSFMSNRDESPFGLALDPAAFLEPEMLPESHDHLSRAFEALGGLCEVVLMTGGELSADGGRIVPTPIHRGVLDPRHMASLLRNCVPATTPVILQAHEAAEQAEALGLDL